jgi:hypothetical protein
MEVKHWADGWHLWDIISFLKGAGALGSSMIYRGHSNASWKLIPSLYRRDVHIYNDELHKRDLYLIAEQRMVDTFFNRAQLLLPFFTRSPCVDRIIAQHYSVPTQLLDWTLDPFIGLHFAVDQADTDVDAALYYMTPMQSVFHHNASIAPYTGKIAQLIPPVIDERIRTQKSIFTVQNFGNQETFIPLDDRTLKYSSSPYGSDPRDEVGSFGKIIIPAKHKKQLKRQLIMLGIDSSLVYPSLQGIGARINALAELNSYGGDGFF